MIAKPLEQWTIQDVRHLVEIGAQESDRFDFKEKLPHPSDKRSKDRLAKSCAAFANSAGGLLIFGVKDSGQRTDRLVGIDAIEFPAHFGNYPSQASPPVEWDFLNPPLQVDGGRVIQIVEITQSWRAPHAVGDRETGWTFPKRTNKGTEYMDYDEVRSMFLGYYEKRLKLQLLTAELAQIRADAQGMIIAPDANDGKSYGLPTIELRVLETVLSDTYSVTQSSGELLAAMNDLRSRARIVNNKVAVFRLEVALPISNKAATVMSHNDFVRPVCEAIIELANTAQDHLNQILS